jgi:RNA polymerase sigma factor for flagellar operon FliA
MSADELRAQQASLHASELRSLNETVGDTDEGDTEVVETLASEDTTADPVHAVIADERMRRFRHAVERLPERERQVAVLRYVQEMTLQEIGEILGVSESRVSQLDSRLKARLRTDLTGTIVESSAA